MLLRFAQTTAKLLKFPLRLGHVLRLRRRKTGIFAAPSLARLEFFNARLFGGKLPACLVTLQRSKKTYGFFAGQRFGLKTGKGATDEIALNPSHFEQRTTEQTLSTLAHEMAHQWQQHHGKPSRTGYHNKEWAAKMIEVGLVPSATGQKGGKQVGLYAAEQ